MTSNCPYCHSAAFQTVTDGTRPRPDVQTIEKCDGCNDYYMRHVTGQTKPLFDRTDKESDAVNNVVG